MNSLIVDANILIEYFKHGGGILEKILDRYQLLLPTVAYTELLANSKAKNESTNRQIRDFVAEHFELVHITPEIAAKAAEIIRDYQATLAVAYTAAVAIDKAVPLITYDIPAFEHIPELKIVDL